MNRDKSQEIAASAYNVCGPKTGEAATPRNVWTFGKNVVLDCMARYADAHDGELFTREEIIAAHNLHVNS